MVWPSGEEGETRKNRPQTLLTDFKPSVSPATEYLIGQCVPDDVPVDIRVNKALQVSCKA